jgi:outer membrane protein OmpA-like peptidoglycan-associated protein
VKANARSVFLTLAVILLGLGSLPASAADIAGSRDHPLLKRYEGSQIILFQQRAYDEYTVPLGRAPTSSSLEKSVTVEGALTRLTYKVPPGRSPLEVVRNFEKELGEKGFQILFQSGGESLGSYFSEAAGYGKLKLPPNIPVLTHNADTQRFLAAGAARADGRITVTVYAVENRFWAANVDDIRKGQVLVQVDIVEGKPMEEKMVTVSSAKMAEQIASTGSVALYGILFDSDRATLRQESRPTLDEIAKLLKGEPKLKLLVVGHTDNVGSFSYNMDLSRQRAEAVAAELSGRYGIATSRLHPVGVSYASPVASNRSEEGRARNRRVELVED